MVLLANSASAARAQTPNKPALPASEYSAHLIEAFERQAEANRNPLKIPGLSIVVIRDGEVQLARGVGYADIEHRVPATPDTLYHIASLTKTFTAILVLQLVEQGKLDLDEPASPYSDDFKDDSVRIKHLLSHTSEGTPGEKFSNLRGPLPAAPPRGHRHRGRRPPIPRPPRRRPERAVRRNSLAVLPEDPAVDSDFREGRIAGHATRLSRQRGNRERQEGRLGESRDQAGT